MKPQLFILIVSILTLSCHCNREQGPEAEQDANGVYIKLPYLWSSLLHRGTQAVFSNTFIESGTVYNNAVLVPTTSSASSRDFTLMNADNGERLWSWNCAIYKDGLGGLIEAHQQDNLLTGQIGKAGYCLDLATGKEKWLIYRPFSLDHRVTGIGNYFFAIGPPQDSMLAYADKVYVGYSGSIETGEIRTCLVPHFTEALLDTGQRAGVAHITPIVNEQSDTLLSVTWGESFSDWHPFTYLGLYNLTRRTWVYDRILMTDPTFDTVCDWMKVENGRVYASVGGFICCHDLYTGAQLWKTQLPQNLLGSGFILTSTLLIANCEDTYLYGLDLASGKQVWKEKSSGTSSPLQQLNGVVYFVGGGDGMFHAVEAATGKHLWRLQSPDGSAYRSGPYMLPGNGAQKPRVVARSAVYAYCYEAAR